MSTTPQAQAAATARQRLAGVLGTLQQDPNIPANILEIVSGLAGAIGPLFKLERGDPDLNLFIQARGVLQQTLEKMQGVDQNFPGVGDATQAIADTLRTIFNALKEAQAAQAAPAPAPAPAAAPAPAPVAQQPFQPQFVQPVAPPQPIAAPPQPIAAPPQAQPAPTPGPFAPAPSASIAQPQAPQQPAPNPYATPSPGSLKGQGPVKSPSGVFRAPPAVTTTTVPVGPTGLPRLETEVNVHSESNFFTDFFGDIRNNGGIFVATFHVLHVGAPCEVSLAFPGNLSADIRGEVKWVRNAGEGTSPGLGISITNANADAWGLIERFVKKREPIMHEM